MKDKQSGHASAASLGRQEEGTKRSVEWQAGSSRNGYYRSSACWLSVCSTQFNTTRPRFPNASLEICSSQLDLAPILLLVFPRKYSLLSPYLLSICLSVWVHVGFFCSLYLDFYILSISLIHPHSLATQLLSHWCFLSCTE